MATTKHITNTQVAKSTPFDNSTNGFAATDTQSAIEEVKSSQTNAASLVGNDDFVYAEQGLDIGHNPLGLLRTTSGAGAAVDILTSAELIDSVSWGVMRFTTGTTATGRAYVASEAGSLRLNTNKFTVEYRVMFPVLPTSAQRFTYYVGFMDTQNAGQPTNGIYFVNSDNINSGHWSLRTVSSSSVSTLDTLITPNVNQWYKLKFEFISSSLVNCYVDTVLVGTIVSNIPVNTAIETTIKLEKSVGSTSRIAYIDSVWWELDR